MRYFVFHRLKKYHTSWKYNIITFIVCFRFRVVGILLLLTTDM